MIKQTITEFAGGLQESNSPDDFSGRQWSQLYGIIPKNATTFESQWAMQSMSPYVYGGTWQQNASAFKEVFPLESSDGTYLVGIKVGGSIWWCRVPDGNVSYSIANATTWYQITEAENTGIALITSAANPILVNDNPSFRFITGLNLPLYKYIKTPFPGRESDFGQDLLPDTIIDYSGLGDEEVVDSLKSRANVPGVLIGARRSLRFTNGTPQFSMTTDIDRAPVPAAEQAMLIAYVDPRVENGAVKIISFPNFRRWPTFKRNFAVNDEDGVPIANWPQVTVDGVVYGVEERGYAIQPFGSTTENPQGIERGFIQTYPYLSTPPYGYPAPMTAFHPYTYLDLNSALLPGLGIIPRGNIGTMWDNRLILGDIEWRSDKAFQATDGDGKVSPGPNRALIGTPALTDGNTEAHRGSFYYSVRDIDEFDPRNVISISGTDARIAGMHQIDNYLICVTTHGGPTDGVFALSGNLANLISYSGTPNPAAVRKQLIRGGVGVAESEEDGEGYRSQTCLWPEAGNVVFIDKSGTIYATDGRSCEAIDRIGPRRPDKSSSTDHVAAMGKHLIVWRAGRLLVFSLLESDGEQAAGCWTELVVPNPNEGVVTFRNGDLRSMVGTATQTFMVIQGQVWRISPESAEKGRINNEPINIYVATPVLGDHSGAKKTNWFRVGFSFFTPTTCTVDYVSTLAESLFTGGTPSPNPSPIPSYTLNVAKSYTSGHYELVVPAGIGPQTVMTTIFLFTGHIVLKGFSYWSSAGTMERGEKP
jgi:hypothetical protein